MESSQKDRWAARADRLEGTAAKLEADAGRLHAVDADLRRDHAFLTQPGHIPARARMNARDDRAGQLLDAAKRHRERAGNLRNMATRNKGDAERARAELRTAEIAVGALTTSLWGRRLVTKVNAKTVRLEGVSCAVDRSHVRVIPA